VLAEFYPPKTPNNRNQIMGYQRTRWDRRREWQREMEIGCVRAFAWLIDLAMGHTPEECTRRLPPLYTKV
jgi:hypothetical protein